MIQSTKKEVFGNFQEFGLFDRLDIAYCDRTKSFPAFGNVTRSWRIIQKSHKMQFWMIRSAKKKEVFGHFLELGLLDRLDIAYCDST